MTKQELCLTFGIMLRSTLAKKIFDISHLTGNFLLRSGQTSTEYFDKYRFESAPEILSEISNHLAPLIPSNTEILASLEMGGIPIGTALSLKTGIPSAFVRKKAKDYGTLKISEGASLQGKRVCIIEDVITTGGQVLLSAEDLKKEGAIVEHVLCVILRGSTAKLEEAGLKVTALFTMEELKSSQQK